MSSSRLAGKNPAIIAVGYNRTKSLERLLDSLLAADYPKNCDIHLIISLDFCNDLNIAEAISLLANSFFWPHGLKRIIYHPQQLGLKKHILSCGDLTEQYNSIIVLEDDLVVSPGYYEYATRALDYYESDKRICGISLYTHHNNPYLRKSFQPLEDGADIFFLNFASSWGQAWNKEQWKSFRDWLDIGKIVGIDDPLPDGVISWPDTSWLKLFIKYMVETGKMFVYPRTSLSTNFGDSGTHFTEQDSYFQVPMQITVRDWNFVPLDHSLAVYDVYFEINFQVLNRLTNRFEGKEYTVDMYGNKNPKKVTTKYMLTTSAGENSISAFGNRMKPSLLNVIYNISGNDIRFCRTAEVISYRENAKNEELSGETLKLPALSLSRKIRFQLTKVIEMAADIMRPRL